MVVRDDAQKLRVSIARLSGSVIAPELATDSERREVELKNTSGLVHVATARLMWIVRNDKPTWYAATGKKGVRHCKKTR
jgi:hypothetical protein